MVRGSEQKKCVSTVENGFPAEGEGPLPKNFKSV